MAEGLKESRVGQWQDVRVQDEIVAENKKVRDGDLGCHGQQACMTVVATVID